MWPVAFPSDNPGPFWPCDHIDIYRPYHRGSYAHLPVEQPLCADRWTGSRAPGKSGKWPGYSEAPAVAGAALDAVQKLVICQSEGRYGLVDKTHPSCVRPGLNTRVQH